MYSYSTEFCESLDHIATYQWLQLPIKIRYPAAGDESQILLLTATASETLLSD